MKLDAAASERRLRRSAWLSAGVLSLLGLPFGLQIAAAIAAGGALSALNLEGIVMLVQGLPEGPRARPSWRAILSVSLRYLLLAFGMFAIVGVWRANVLALSLGLSAPVCAVFVEWGLEAMSELRRGGHEGDQDPKGQRGQR